LVRETMEPLPTPHSLITDPRIRAAYSEGAGIYRVVPQAVAVPSSVSELRHLVDYARTKGTTLIPRGAGSGMGGGNVGRGVVVDVRSLGGVTIDGPRKTARTGAAVTWAALNAAARDFGLRLPPDPSSGAFATCGGMVATNAAGPRTVRYGSVRPWVEALEVVEVGGGTRTIRRGGGAGPWSLTPKPQALQFPRTRKNSSGYALDAYTASGDEIDLWVGSEGTLGFITAVEWRLDAIPPDTAGVALGFRDLEALGEAVPFLLALNPSAVELLDATLLAFVAAAAGVPAGLACLILVEFERETQSAARGVVGDAVRGLQRHTAHVATAIDRAGLDQLWHVRRMASPALARLPETRRSLQVVEDGCVPIERLGEYIAGLRAAADEHGVPVAIFGHAGDGHVHVNAQPDITREGWKEDVRGLFTDVTSLQVRLAGTPSGEHGDGRLRAGVLERFFGASGTDAFRSLKHAYDPLTILNPGVIIPAADWDPLADLKVGADAAPIPADVAASLRNIERSAAWGVAKHELVSHS
jgi:FAD/FMN-containing dehydrogenase